MGIMESYERSEESERKRREGYRATNYAGENCKNCGRNRVMNCANGKHVCEKCGWDADANQYDPSFRPT